MHEKVRGGMMPAAALLLQNVQLLPGIGGGKENQIRGKGTWNLDGRKKTGDGNGG